MYLQGNWYVYQIHVIKLISTCLSHQSKLKNETKQKTDRFNAAVFCFIQSIRFHNFNIGTVCYSHILSRNKSRLSISSQF